MRQTSPTLLGVSSSAGIKKFSIMELEDGYKFVQDYFRTADIENRRKSSYFNHRNFSYYNESEKNSIQPEPSTLPSRKRFPDDEVRSSFIHDYHRHLSSFIPNSIIQANPRIHYERNGQHNLIHHRDVDSYVPRQVTSYYMPASSLPPTIQNATDSEDRTRSILSAREHEASHNPDSESEKCKLPDPCENSSSLSSSDSKKSLKRSGSPSIHSPKKKWMHCYMAVGTNLYKFRENIGSVSDDVQCAYFPCNNRLLNF